jgi:hypothetical protein
VRRTEINSGAWAVFVPLSRGTRIFPRNLAPFLGQYTSDGQKGLLMTGSQTGPQPKEKYDYEIGKAQQRQEN